MLDWNACEYVETVPGKLGGQPVIKGTRVRAETIINNLEAGSPLSEIAENWPELPMSVIEGIIRYYRSHQLVPHL